MLAGRVAPLVAVWAAVTSSAASAQQPAFPPFSFADVDFDADCRPNAALARLLTVLHGRAGTAEGAAIDTPLYDAVAGDTFHRLILDQPADWHGLRLKGVDLYLGIERGPANYTLIFDNPPSQVREVWDARGRTLPALGERRAIEVAEGHASIMLDGVEGPGAGAAVTCFRD